MNTQQPPKASTTTANAEGGVSEEQAFLAEVRKLEDTARLYQSEVHYILFELITLHRANMSRPSAFWRSYYALRKSTLASTVKR